MNPVVNDLKKHTFFSLLEAAGRVFIHVMPSGGAVLGNRGFLPEEMEKGIVLVFNRKMKFDWGDGGISASLVFGTAAQQCFIPTDDIIAVFSPELETRLILEPRQQTPEKPAFPPGEGKKEKEHFNPVGHDEAGDEDKNKKLIKVDFRKKEREE